jgi:hypothetical protein
MTESIVDIRDDFRRRIDAVRNRRRLVELVRGGALTLLTALGAGLALLVLEGLFRLGPTVRTVMAASWTLLVVVVLSLTMGLPLLRRVRLVAPESDETIARLIGGVFPDVRDRLLNALQLCASPSGTEPLYSAELVEQAVRDVYTRCAPKDFAGVVSFVRARHLWYGAGLLTAVAVVLFLLLPSFAGPAALRLWHYSLTYEDPAPYRLAVAPGDADVVKGESVRIAVRVEGPGAPSIVLSTRRDGETALENRLLERGEDGVYRHELAALKSSTSYWVRAGRVESPTYRLRVVDRPAIRSLKASLRFPAYAGMAPRELPENTGDITALRGTDVALSILSNKALATAWVRFDGESLQPLRVDGKKASGSFRLMRERTYQILLRDSLGVENTDPITFALRPLPDASPTVSILFPGPALDVADNAVVPLLVRASDDFGVMRARLRYRLAQSRYERPQEQFAGVDLRLPLRGGRELSLSHRWDLSPLSLAPQDVVEYYVEAFDNDAVTGPKAGVSETHVLRLPSLEEVLAAADQEQDKALAMMESMLQEVEEARRKLASLQQDVKQAEQRSDWQERQKSDELLRKYEEVRKQVEAVNRNLEKMVGAMQENRLLSPETLQKYEELQELMQQIASPEFAEAMKRLQEAMQTLNPEEMQRALQKLALSEEEFRKNLERTISLLKRIQIEQKLDEMVRRAEQLSQEQENLRSATERSDSDSARAEAARRQRDLAEQSTRLKQEMEALAQRMEEFPGEMPEQQMREAGRELERAELERRMQEIAGQIASGQTPQALAGQREALADMERFSASMKAVKEAMQAGQTQQVLNAMKGIERDLLELSRRQEELRNGSRSLEPTSPRFRESAQEQVQLAGDLGSVAERLSALSQKTFSVSPEMGRSLGEAFREMRESLSALEQRNATQAAQQQQAAMGSLNETAQQVQTAMNGLMQGGSGGMGMAGLLQRLRQVSAGQEQLNRETGGLSPSQAAELGRLAAEQGALRKSLEQLAREAAESGQSSRLLGDLRTIAGEMREVQTDLAQGELTPETLQRQEKILSRLLDSQRSARERDFERKRRAETGTDVARGQVPEAAPAGQNEKARLRRDLLRALEEGYARDYQELIRKYFEALDR